MHKGGQCARLQLHTCQVCDCLGARICGCRHNASECHNMCGLVHGAEQQARRLGQRLSQTLNCLQ
jgi:hypothetical protein